MTSSEPRLDRYLEHLRSTPGVGSLRLEPVKAAQRFDGVLRLRARGGSFRLAVVEVKSHLGHAAADRLIASPRSAELPLILCAPHIGGPLGVKLAAAGINYVDRQGNCHLDLDDGVFVHVEGRAAERSSGWDSAVRAAGYQTLFALLAEPELLRATVRVVAKAASVSRQAVSDMRRRLAAERYIADTPSGAHWLPRRRDDALEFWLHGYASTVRPSLLLGTYRTRDATPKDLEQRIAPILDRELSEWRWGGAAAGHRLAGHYRGQRTVIHVHATPSRFERTLGGLTDPRGNLVVLTAFGEINWVRDKTVHPLLVYSEILTEGTERAREAAQVLFEKQILPRWKEGA